jgi:hypothetical protein
VGCDVLVEGGGGSDVERYGMDVGEVGCKFLGGGESSACSLWLALEE